MGALLFQVGISGPLVLALILYTAARRDRGLVHRYLLVLLVLILVWMIGMVLHVADPGWWGALGDAALYTAACFMSPVFCVTMLLYARVELFEVRREARWAVLAPFALFLLAFLTDPWHGQMAGSLSVLMPSDETPHAPPLFWSFQVCSNLVALVGFAACVRAARTSPLADERRRMWLLCAGALVPLIAHVVFVLRVVPTEVKLTPSALGITSLLIVRAIHRYRLLDVQPVARRDVIEASSDAVVVADADGRVVDLNPSAIALLRGDREALLGSPLEAVLEPLGNTDVEGVLRELLERAGAGERPPASELETSEGRILEASVGRPSDPAGAGTFLVLRDRTKERRAERLLQQSQKLESVGILAAGVAHEVNNPLAFVRSNLTHLHQIANDLESRGEELPKDLSDQTRELADVVEESIAGLDRIQKIVQGLLRLSRSAPECSEICDPNTIVAEAARFASLERDPTVRVELRLAEDVPSIHASPDQLAQVLLNLFLNARHALRDRPDATIVASTAMSGEGDEVEIRVEDNGPGVPESIRDKIFDPFFTTRPPNEGTGLGLPIAFDIVCEHGGTLAFEESASGGACFVVRLPACDRTGV